MRTAPGPLSSGSDLVDVALVGQVAVDDAVHDARAVRVDHELGAVADQAAGRHEQLQLGLAAQLRRHVDQVATPERQLQG